VEAGSVSSPLRPISQTALIKLRNVLILLRSIIYSVVFYSAIKNGMRILLKRLMHLHLLILPYQFNSFLINVLHAKLRLFNRRKLMLGCYIWQHKVRKAVFV
jgi:hypothetical protein